MMKYERSVNPFILEYLNLTVGYIIDSKHSYNANTIFSQNSRCRYSSIGGLATGKRNHSPDTYFFSRIRESIYKHDSVPVYRTAYEDFWHTSGYDALQEPCKVIAPMVVCVESEQDFDDSTKSKHN
jgi:hypothetical protein